MSNFVLVVVTATVLFMDGEFKVSQYTLHPCKNNCETLASNLKKNSVFRSIEGFGRGDDIRTYNVDSDQAEVFFQNLADEYKNTDAAIVYQNGFKAYNAPGSMIIISDAKGANLEYEPDSVIAAHKTSIDMLTTNYRQLYPKFLIAKSSLDDFISYVYSVKDKGLFFSEESEFCSPCDYYNGRYELQMFRNREQGYLFFEYKYGE